MDKKKFTLSIGVSLAMLAMGAFFIVTDIAVPIVVRVLGYDELTKGVILLVVNGLPLVFYPISAKFSDRCKSRYGRRTPFIFWGSLVTSLSLIAAVLFARGNSIWGFAVCVTIASVAIAFYRPAAQSLQPDVIPPEYRSATNSVANVVMGATNFATVGLVILFGDKYFWIFIVVAIVIALSFIIFRIFVNEPKMLAANDFNVQHFNAEEIGPTGVKYLKTFEKSERWNLFLLLACIFMCNFGYTAVSVTAQNYAVIVWGMSDNLAAVLTIAMGVGGAAMLLVAPFIGRKTSNRITMLISIIIILVGFLLVFKIKTYTPWLFVFFAIFGGGWTGFNVVALPAVLNFSDIRNNAMFTSAYVVTCNLPKAITCLTSGLMINGLGYQSLFPYTMICIGVGAAFMILSIFQHKREVVKI